MSACAPHPPFRCGRHRLVGLSLVTVLAVVGSLGMGSPTSLVLTQNHPGSEGMGSVPSPAIAPSDEGSPSSWANISSLVGPGPSNRSISQAAYSPALNATILFGGYNGVGGNFPLGDTWSFSNNTWTELFPAVSPSPRWGATMVYDPVDRTLVMYGGRNATEFFGDTWEYNATGWHPIATPSAPFPRYDYGMAYDARLGEVVLYGGAEGNLPAGSFSPFTFYNDTWTFQNGTWTNVTTTVGTGPVGRLLRGQMTYDAADGDVLVTGGYSYVRLGTEGPCGGYVVFQPTWGETWVFNGTAWSQVYPSGAVPPDGVGVLWYDSEANETLYYEGMWVDGGLCDLSGNQIWSYSAGNWTLVTEGNISAPLPREQPIFVNDVGDNEQLEFGGEMAANASEYFAVYLDDTWTYQPTWVRFEPHALPSGAAWEVAVGHTASGVSDHSLLFVEAPGKYAYTVVVRLPHQEVARAQGSFALVHGPKFVIIGPEDLHVILAGTAGPRTEAAVFWEPWATVLAGAAVGVTVVGVWSGTQLARQRARLRAEGDALVRAMQSGPPTEPPVRRT